VKNTKPHENVRMKCSSAPESTTVASSASRLPSVSTELPFNGVIPMHMLQITRNDDVEAVVTFDIDGE
jgi:hypothetical protein